MVEAPRLDTSNSGNKQLLDVKDTTSAVPARFDAIESLKDLEGLIVEIDFETSHQGNPTPSNMSDIPDEESGILPSSVTFPSPQRKRGYSFRRDADLGIRSFIRQKAKVTRLEGENDTHIAIEETLADHYFGELIFEVVDDALGNGSRPMAGYFAESKTRPVWDSDNIEEPVEAEENGEYEDLFYADNTEDYAEYDDPTIDYDPADRVTSTEILPEALNW